MATKKQIQNMVDIINEKYRFADENGEWCIKAERSLNGWQIALGPDGRWSVVLTQHREVSSETALLMLHMLFHDILERQNLGHYNVAKRV